MTFCLLSLNARATCTVCFNSRSSTNAGCPPLVHGKPGPYPNPFRWATRRSLFTKLDADDQVLLKILLEGCLCLRVYDARFRTRGFVPIRVPRGPGHSLESMSDGISHAPDRRRQAFYAHAPLLKALKRSQVGYIIAPSSFPAHPLLLTSSGWHYKVWTPVSVVEILWLRLL